MSGTEAHVDVIVVNYNTAHLLAPMREALEAAAPGVALQWIVVDNASRDDSRAALGRVFADATVIANDTNVGFGRANNQALPHLRSPWVLLLNTDAFAGPEALSRALAHLRAQPRIGVLGVRLTGRDGELQPSRRWFPTPWNLFLQRSGAKRWFPRTRLVDDVAWDPTQSGPCDWVPGCFYLMRREVVDTVGLFDPRFFLYCEEVDHCRRVKAAGWQVGYLAEARCVHLGGESAASEGSLDSGRQLPALQVESELLYFRKHYGRPGVAAWLALCLLATLMRGARGLLRGAGGRARTAGALADLRRVWASARATHAGAVPTR